jgi:hypothetical protein
MKDESERQNIKKTDHNKPKFSKKIHNFVYAKLKMCFVLNKVPILHNRAS